MAKQTKSANELIIIEQLPILKERLKEISADIQKDIDFALSLECIPESKQLVKQTRAELAKKFENFESRRIVVKKAILAPYDEFDKEYKIHITDKFKNVKLQLDAKINEIEDAEKEKLRIEAVGYFNEYLSSKNIDFISFEKIIPKVNLSDTPTKLKKTISEYLDKVSDELKLIGDLDHKEEILIEYKVSLNAARAISTVSDRYKAIEAEKERQLKIEEQNAVKEEVIGKVNEVLTKEPEPLSAPKVVQKKPADNSDPIKTVSFRVTHNISKLKELKQYMVEGGFIIAE